MLELLAWVVLLCLLFRVLAKLTDIYALIRPVKTDSGRP